ncbi:hypothetical protein [Burkholderia sp. BCC0322]|uniref:hypothetical protein n=1 Tax=unclassified Burkholderia TaxID=2613784 RepID=UPI00158C4DCF|nr:hypothetical protein [Burkholderia sp. BCC0322]
MKKNLVKGGKIIATFIVSMFFVCSAPPVVAKKITFTNNGHLISYNVYESDYNDDLWYSEEPQKIKADNCARSSWYKRADGMSVEKCDFFW